jgi:hypothetical protein
LMPASAGERVDRSKQNDRCSVLNEYGFLNLRRSLPFHVKACNLKCLRGNRLTSAQLVFGTKLFENEDAERGPSMLPKS